VVSTEEQKMKIGACIHLLLHHDKVCRLKVIYEESFPVGKSSELIFTDVVIPTYKKLFRIKREK